MIAILECTHGVWSAGLTFSTRWYNLMRMIILDVERDNSLYVPNCYKSVLPYRTCLDRCTYWWYPCSSWSSGIQGVLRIKTCKLKLSYTTCVSNSRYMVHVTKSSLCSLQCSSVEFWLVYGITRVQFVEQLNCTSGSRRRWLTGWILLPNDNDKWFSYTG